MDEFLKLGLVGHPVGHSKSPLIHNYWIKKYDLAGEYKAIDVRPDNLESVLDGLMEEGYKGFNVTIPHKETALTLCDSVDDIAQAVGAVNTICIENGQLNGINTDVFGFLENIRGNRPQFGFSTAPAVVLGAGGAARAVVQGLLQEDVPEIRLLNRTRGKAEILARACKDRSKIHVLDWEDRHRALKGAGLLVNTTALGMEGHSQLDIDLAALPEDATLNDIVYAPPDTGLLKQAQSRGNAVVGGIGMLLHQARPAFQSWTGVMPEIDQELMDIVMQ